MPAPPSHSVLGIRSSYHIPHCGIVRIILIRETPWNTIVVQDQKKVVVGPLADSACEAATRALASDARMMAMTSFGGRRRWEGWKSVEGG